MVKEVVSEDTSLFPNEGILVKEENTTLIVLKGYYYNI
jgi:hypothetical protein